MEHYNFKIKKCYAEMTVFGIIHKTERENIEDDDGLHRTQIN